MLALSPQRAPNRARARARRRPSSSSSSSSSVLRMLRTKPPLTTRVRRDTLLTSRQAVPACYRRDEIPKHPSSPFGAEFPRCESSPNVQLTPWIKRDALLTSPAKWAGTGVIGRITQETPVRTEPHPTKSSETIISNPKTQYHEPPTRNPNLCRLRYPQK
jgi:hypothetical protein